MESTTLEYGKHKEFLLQNMPKYIKAYVTGNIRGQKEPLLPEQQEVLEDYYLYLVTENGKTTSYYSYINSISNVSLFARIIRKPFNQVVKEDIKQFLFYLKSKGREESTINQYRIKLKTFFRFLYGTKEYPEVVEWIEEKKIRHENKTEEELLSKQDIRLMIENTKNARDRAIVSVLYESAARRTEFLSMNVKHIIPDKYGIKIKLPQSKTKTRTIRLIDSLPYLQEWINVHPNKDNLESPLFVSLDKSFGKRLGVQGLKYALIRLKDRAKIQKKINPHLFRHSRLNQLAKDGFNERDLKLFAGWSDDSKMPKVYLHYGEKELDNKILQKHGKLDVEDTKEELKEKEALTPRDCTRCKTINSATSKYCNSCGMALDLKTVMEDKTMYENMDILRKETDNRLKVYAEIMANPERRAKFEEFKKIFFNS